MKKIFLLLIVVIISNCVMAQGITFRDISFKEAQKIAKKERKPIMIDMYTSWCGPCKYLASDVFPKAEAGAYFNEHFICLKYDAEKSEDGKMLSKKHTVPAYPTILFVNAEGDLVYLFSGVKEVPELIKEGEKALNAFANKPKLDKMQKRYEKGDRSVAFLDEFIGFKSSFGVNCSEPIIDYLALIDDSSFVKKENTDRLSTVTIYNEALLKRSVEIAKHNTTKEVIVSMAIYMGKSISEAATNDNEPLFNKLLEIKADYYKISGMRDNLMMTFLLNANMFIPSDLMRLEYYKTKKKDQKFTPTYLKYMEELQLKDKEKSEEERQTELKNVFVSMDYMYIAASMIDHMDYYLELNGKMTQQQIDWYWFLIKYYPSCKHGACIAEKLYENNFAEEAIKILNFSLENGQKKNEEDSTLKCQELLKQYSGK